MLRSFLECFPRAGRYWKSLAELEIKAGNQAAADKIFKDEIVTCANLDLWRAYIKVVMDRIPKKTTDENKEEAKKAESETIEVRAAPSFQAKLIYLLDFIRKLIAI